MEHSIRCLKTKMLTRHLNFIRKFRSGFFPNHTVSRYSLRARPSTTSGVSITIAGKSLSEVTLLGVAKTGNLSWGGYLSKQPVKIYQTFNCCTAEYIARLSNDPVLGEYFPKILHIYENYVIAEWIEGKTVCPQIIQRNPRLLCDIVEMQAKFHSHTCITDTEPFDYITFLRDRLLRYLGPFAQNKAVKHIVDICSNKLDTDLPVRVSHPDITPTNMVFEKRTGKLKVIDNELLTKNIYYLIDLFNTYQSFTGWPQIAKSYIESYCNSGSDLTLLVEYRSFFTAIWNLRLLGSMLQAGQMSQFHQLAKQIDSGRMQTHQIIRMAERSSKA